MESAPEEKKPITLQDIESYKKEYDSKPMNRIIQNVLAKNKIAKTIKINDTRVYNRHLFEIDIPTMKATNQQSSGRCWIFAGLNILRETVAKKLKISDFELSQNYVAFYDKFEKINYTLESIIELCPRDYDDRTLCHVLKEGIQDGGQWDMFANIINKYGVVSEEVAKEMAEFGRKLLNVDICVSVTGNAGPTTEPGGKPVGCFYVGISSKKGTSAKVFQKTQKRNEVRNSAVLAMRDLTHLEII